MRTGKNLLKRKSLSLDSMDIRPRGRMKIEWGFHYTQKNLSSGLVEKFFFWVNAEKLVNMVFNVNTLSVKIKALKIVDRDRI